MPSALGPIRRRLFPRERISPEEVHGLLFRWCWRVVIVGAVVLALLQPLKADWSAPYTAPYCPEHNLCPR